MNALSGNALDQLIAPITHAVRTKEARALGGVLAALCASGAITPECFWSARADRYARKLVWRDTDAGFIVVGMTWAAGQGAPLHDHAGLWGAEIVVDGMMHETAFELTGRARDGRFGFCRGTHRLSERGTVGLIEPPREYHDFGNAGKTVAHSLHVYGGELTSAQTFREDSDGWWTARRVGLRYDAE